MKTIIWIASLTLLSAGAHASTVFIVSDALDTTNNTTDPTVDITPNPQWAAALPGSDWISYGSTGDPSAPGYFSPPNGTVVSFQTQFTLTGAITGGYLDVLADDTTSVMLNGNTLMVADLTPGGPCAKGPIGCLTSTEGMLTFAMLAPYLVDGTNTLSFSVVQVAAQSFGLDFAGSIDPGSPTPEPAALALVGLGLLGLAVRRRR
jgi:hypothetical protein